LALGYTFGRSREGMMRVRAAVAVLLAFATAGFRIRRTSQMVDNYYWLYDRTSAFSYKKKH